MCAYTRARVRKWSGRLTETRLVCSDSSHVLRDTGRLLRKLYWRGIWDVEVWFYLSLQKLSVLSCGGW